MKTLLVIGIGAGDPDYLTLQAIAALNRASTFFLFDKGTEKDSLIHLRETICARHIRQADYRFVTAPIPERRREGDYRQAVDDLNAAKQALMVEMIEQELRTMNAAPFWSGAIRRCTTAPCASWRRSSAKAGWTSTTR